MKRLTCFVLVVVCLALVAGLGCAASAYEPKADAYTVRFAWIEIGQTLDKPLGKGQAPALPLSLDAILPAMGSDPAAFLDNMRTAWPKLSFQSLHSLDLECVEDQTCTMRVNRVVPNEIGKTASSSVSKSGASAKVHGRQGDMVVLDWECTFTPDGNGGASKSSRKLELGKTYIVGGGSTTASSSRKVKGWVLAVSVVPGAISLQDPGLVAPVIDTK